MSEHKTSIHDLSIKKLALEIPDLRTKGFAAKLAWYVSCIDSDDVTEELCKDVRKKARFVPDAYAFDGMTVSIYEVEDTSPISRSKLEKIVDLWFLLDYAGVELKLFVLDRYATEAKEVPLFPYFYLIGRESA